MSIKTINSESPAIRDKMLSQTIGKYPMVKAPLIEPIGKTIDIYSTPNKKEYFIDEGGLLEYTSNEVMKKIDYSKYRDVDSFVLKYIDKKNKYTKDNTYLDKTGDNLFEKITNPMLGYFLGETPALSISGNNHWDFSSSSDGDTIVGLSARVVSGQETEIGKVGLRVLGTSLFNSVLDKTRRNEKVDEFLKKPLELFNAIDELDVSKSDLPTGLENFIGGYFPIYLYSEIKRDEYAPNLGDNFYWDGNGGTLKLGDGVKITDNNNNFNKQSLLYKTQTMFANSKIKSILSTVEDNVSRGTNLKRKGENGNYFRTWSADSQYRKIIDLHTTLEDDEKKKLDVTLKRFRPSGDDNLKAHGVMQDNGFVRVAPNKNDVFDKTDSKNVKKYMFSIENLAWKDSIDSIIQGTSQEGPNGGRIMWFPPYDIKFTENTGVNIESNIFIGRGEPVYTYVNTERTGTIDFKLIVDSPSVVDIYNQNQNKENLTDDDYHRLFWGKDIIEISGGTSQNDINNPTPPKPIPKEPTPDKIYRIKIFFPNNLSGVDFDPIDKLFEYLYHGKAGNYDGGKGYEMMVGAWNGLNLSGDTNLSRTNFCYVVDKNLNKEDVDNIFVNNNKDSYSYSLNSNTQVGIDFSFFQLYRTLTGNTQETELIEILKLVKKIEITGFASSHGVKKKNIKIAKQRAESCAKWLRLPNNLSKLGKNLKPEMIISKSSDKSVTLNNKDINTEEAKSGRYVEIKFITNSDSETIAPNNTKNSNSETSVKETVIINETSKTIREKKDMYMFSATNPSDGSNSKLFNDESKFFEYRNKDEDFIYKTYAEKIKYFHPAFHSTTPEGFNSRLTFLHQCTRQGPTGNNIGMATNMAFGRPPICVLRIGDFYNTKVLFDSLNITYEPLVWDLNPEGIGVQPMIANVTMGFKFIGGSDLGGPIARLQNAITFNFFANTGVYDDRNDRKMKINDFTDKELTGAEGNKNIKLLDSGNAYYPMYNPFVYEMATDGTKISTITQTPKTAADGITDNVTKTAVKIEPVKDIWEPMKIVEKGDMSYLGKFRYYRIYQDATQYSYGGYFIDFNKKTIEVSGSYFSKPPHGSVEKAEIIAQIRDSIRGDVEADIEYELS